ncbi:MAG: SufE family protein [Pseudomonadota bacterium]
MVPVRGREARCNAMERMDDIEEIVETFDLLEDWDERYRLIIDMGRALPAMDEALKTAASKVEGCVSQVWLVSRTDEDDPQRLRFVADSDAHIVRGLIAMLLAAYDGKTGREIIALDADELFSRLGLDSHLSPNRRNGLGAMVARIRTEAERASGGEKVSIH